MNMLFDTIANMQAVRVYRLGRLSKAKAALLETAQREAAKVWNLCVQEHLKARQAKSKWPERNALQLLTKGRAELHSQSVQMVVRSFVGNIDATKEVRKENEAIRYPYKEKQFYPVSWPAQAICKEQNRVLLPMGRKRKSLTFPIALPEDAGSIKLIWNNGYELHVASERGKQDYQGRNQAAVDLGEIHLAAVTANTGKALVVSGRGIRALKRQQVMQVGEIQHKQSRCQKRSRRWKKLQQTKAKQLSRSKRRVRDLRHKATRQVITFCQQENVESLYVGNPHGVRRKSSGRKHNQRLATFRRKIPGQRESTFSLGVRSNPQGC
jgi:putative transposase